MSEENNHINFTAADIEKYHKGQLSAKEMHDLEKAALDDPFLADALEGYSVAGVNADADIAELKKRLKEKIEGAKIVSINTGSRKTFSLLRVAAMIVLVAGAGLLIYQFAFNKSRNDEVAKLENKKAEPATSRDTSVRLSDTLTTGNDIATNKFSIKNSNPEALKTKPVRIITTVTSNNLTSSGALSDSTAYGLASTTNSPVVKAPAKTVSESGYIDVLSGKDQKKNADDIVKEEAKEKVAGGRKDFERDVVMDKKQAEGLYKISKPVADNNRALNQQRDNFFRGRVTDNNNNPVPFANVTNTEDNAGTYADAKGYFNFLSPDTVLNVQVRSIGFNNSNVQLRNNLVSNQVIMQEDKSLNEVVISNKKPNALARSRDANMKLEEPEPEDGWGNYDTYLVNNLNVPEEIKTKQTGGKVEVSFEVDKNGEPVRIKVEKSLCAKCDQEAIRLIKQGPKWKRKAKNGRTTVTIPFLNSF